MRKILMTADTVGGVWTYALDLAHELGTHGIEVVLATMGKPLNREQRQALRLLSNVELRESSYRLEWMEDPWRDVRDAGEWLLSLAGESQPDLVHLNSYCHAQLPWDRPTLVVAHSDVYSWFRGVHGGAPGPEWRRYHEQVSQGLHAAKVVVAPSRATLNDVNRAYGQLPRTRVIPNGRDPRWFREAKKGYFILTVGRVWDEAKNIRALDSVAAGLDAPILAAGSSKSPDGVKCSTECLTSLGELAPGELAEYFARAPIYALPAKYEPFGLSILEGASSGCALVLGDIPSLRENWQNAALFVDPNDPEALRRVLARLLRDEPLRRELGQRARERSRFFSLKKMGLAYLQLYRALVNPASPVRNLPVSQEQFLPREIKIQEI